MLLLPHCSTTQVHSFAYCSRKPPCHFLCIIEEGFRPFVIDFQPSPAQGKLLNQTKINSLGDMSSCSYGFCCMLERKMNQVKVNFEMEENTEYKLISDNNWKAFSSSPTLDCSNGVISVYRQKSSLVFIMSLISIGLVYFL
ncbi:hypothetical protein HMI54_007070 [Coelomomyces lativittatus]|nr:hypothetical protein HMI54_007070 [Coelomomyces lativittatus]